MRHRRDFTTRWKLGFLGKKIPKRTCSLEIRSKKKRRALFNGEERKEGWCSVKHEMRTVKHSHRTVKHCQEEKEKGQGRSQLTVADEAGGSTDRGPAGRPGQHSCRESRKSLLILSTMHTPKWHLSRQFSALFVSRHINPSLKFSGAPKHVFVAELLQK